MKDNNENKIHIVTDNVAVPEIKTGDESIEEEKENDTANTGTDVAIPEYHSNKK